MGRCNGGEHTAVHGGVGKSWVCEGSSTEQITSLNGLAPNDCVWTDNGIAVLTFLLQCISTCTGYASCQQGLGDKWRSDARLSGLGRTDADFNNRGDT